MASSSSGGGFATTFGLSSLGSAFEASVISRSLPILMWLWEFAGDDRRYERENEKDVLTVAEGMGTGVSTGRRGYGLSMAPARR